MKTNILPIKESIFEIDNSGAGEFYTCPFKGFIKQILRLIPKEEDTSATNFGSGVHRGMEVWYETSDKAQAIEATLQHFVESPQQNPLDPRNPERAARLVSISIEKYQGVDYKPALLKALDGSERLGVEVPFRKKLGEVELEADVLGWDREYKKGEVITIMWIGMIDLLYRKTNGSYGIMDHKTTSNFYNFFSRYQESGQFKGYLWAVNEILKDDLGDEYNFIEEYTINGLYCPSRGNPKIDESNVDRHAFRSTREKLDHWKELQSADIKNWIRMGESGEWSRNGFSNCGFQYGSRCKFLEVCQYNKESWGNILASPVFKNYEWHAIENNR